MSQTAKFDPLIEAIVRDAFDAARKPDSFRCEACAHFVPFHKEETEDRSLLKAFVVRGLGTCRRNAPSIHVIGNACYPTVGKDFTACGEFELDPEGRASIGWGAYYGEYVPTPKSAT